jgi:hypothetical protein
VTWTRCHIISIEGEQVPREEPGTDRLAKMDASPQYCDVFDNYLSSGVSDDYTLADSPLEA